MGSRACEDRVGGEEDTPEKSTSDFPPEPVGPEPF